MILFKVLAELELLREPRAAEATCIETLIPSQADDTCLAVLCHVDLEACLVNVYLAVRAAGMIGLSFACNGIIRLVFTRHIAYLKSFTVRVIDLNIFKFKLDFLFFARILNLIIKLPNLLCNIFLCINDRAGCY